MEHRTHEVFVYQASTCTGGSKCSLIAIQVIAVGFDILYLDVIMSE